MATRGTVAVQNPDGTVTGIYTHWDSYPSHNGRILHENYTTEAAVRELISLGDLSVLGETIGVKVNFNDYGAHRGQCLAYGRDRGETDIKARTCHNWRQFVAENGQDYNYLFVPGEGWRVLTNSSQGQLLEDVLSEEKESE